MKKTAVSLILTMLFAGSAYAETNSKSEEAVLNNVLMKLLEDNSVSDKKVVKSTIVKKETVAPVKQTAEVVTKEVAEQPKVEKESVYIPLELHTKNLRENNLLDKNSISSEKLLDSDNISDKLLNENLVMIDISTSKKEVDLKQNEGHMFLLNVPIKSEVRVNVDLTIPPYRNTLSYHKGKLVSESPFKYSEKVTYCHIDVEESGFWRRFKAEEDKILVIDGNVSNKVKYNSNINEGEVITVYETIFSIDNPHIKRIVCETSEKELPLTIKDLQDATGNLFNFSYTPMLDI